MNTYQSFPFKLRHCVWEITLACCFRCAYCGSRGGTARDNELSTEECINVARQLCEMGCRRVSLIGGEVFMRRDWREIVRSLTSRGIITSIITNGFHLTPEIIQALRELEIESVAVSLDGVAEVHDPFRQKGSFNRALFAIDTLTEANIPTSVITALRSDNAPRLPELYEVLRTRPIFAWQIQACSPMGNACDNELSVSFDASQVMKFIRETAPSAPFRIGAADNIGYYTPDEPFVRGNPGSAFMGCSAGLSAIGIDSVGNVRGCESMYAERFIEGNLRERSLEDIWTDPDSFSYNRKFDASLLTGGCRDCPKGDVCAGGCRSYNYFTTGRMYENALCPRAFSKAKP